MSSWCLYLLITFSQSSGDLLGSWYKFLLKLGYFEYYVMKFWILYKSFSRCSLTQLCKGKGDIYYSVIARWGWKFRFSSWPQWILKGYGDAWLRFAEAWTPERGSLPKAGPVPVSTGDRNVLTTGGFQDVLLPPGQPFREPCSGPGDTRGGREGWVQVPMGVGLVGLGGLVLWPVCISVVHIY